MTTIFMFPGQSSKHHQMFEKLMAWDTFVTPPILQKAADVLGWSPMDHYTSGDPQIFDSNLHIQVGVFLANHCHMKLLQRAGIDGTWSLGLSLGEYNHLVHIGAIGFEDALELIVARGNTYDNGPRGKMAAVYPVPAKRLIPLIESVDFGGVVEVSNRNSPYQQVLSGDGAAVEAALAWLKDDHDLDGKIIEDRVPMHSSVFRAAADALSPTLTSARWKTPMKPYFPNVLGEPIDKPSGVRIASLLHRHAYQAVLWEDSIRWLLANVEEPVFVEVGPGAVLHRMLQGRWCKRAAKWRTDSKESFDEALQELAPGAGD